MQQAFDKMRLLMAADALAGYLDHNKRFNLYVGYRTNKFLLPVMPLAVPITETVRVM